MKNLHRIALSSLLLIGLLATSFHRLSADDCCKDIKTLWQKSSCIERALAIGVPIVLVGGIVLLYRLLTREESNEKMYMRARFLHDDNASKYHRTQVLLSNYLTRSLSEAELVLLAPHPEIQMLAQVAQDIARLRDMRDILQARISRDTRKGGPIIYEMNTILRDIKKLIIELEKLAEFWREYMLYFIGYTTLKNLVERYEQVRQDVTSQDLVRQVIMSIAVGGNVSYPYLTFTRSLKNNVDKLAQTITTLRNYPVLYGTAQALHTELNSLLGMVVTFPEYANELYLEKQHQLEQERIAVERQKAQAEQDKVYAMREKAAAEREKVAAMYAQAAAEREKAHAIKEQTLVQLVQPQPAININIQPPAQASPSRTYNNY